MMEAIFHPYLPGRRETYPPSAYNRFWVMFQNGFVTDDLFLQPVGDFSGKFDRYDGETVAWAEMSRPEISADELSAILRKRNEIKNPEKPETKKRRTRK